MPFFQEKPVTIRAVQVTHANLHELTEWLKAEPFSTPPMRAITGISFYDANNDETHVALEGEWVVHESSTNTFSVMSAPEFNHKYQEINNE